MSEFNQSKRPGAYVKALLAGLLAVLVFWACHLNEGDGDAKFNLTPDSAWAKCDFLTVELRDTNDQVIDTIFNDSLKSLDQLKGLDASKYKGGKAAVRITGTVNGNICIEQSRTFDDKGGPVKIDTISLPGTAPKKVEFLPASLSLNLGDSATEIQAFIKPAFADQQFEWEVDDPSIAYLDLRFGKNDGRAFVRPLKKGVTKIKSKALLDPTVVGELIVLVGSSDGKSIFITPDTMDLYLGGPDSAFVAVVAPIDSKDLIEWTSTDNKIVTVDDKGRVKPVAAGTAFIKAKFGSVTAESRVRVERDAPVLTVAAKSGAAINAPITFSPKVTQKFGAIVMFKFDLQGDGTWDDSLPGPFLGTTVDLPPQTASYAKEGKFKARFLVRDSEGNESTVEAAVDIGNQPPETVSKSKDTLVSIKDLVLFEAKVRDAEGKVALVGWDYDNDGKLDDSVKASDSTATLKGSHKYDKEGNFFAILIATDESGKSGRDSVGIEVLLDPPEADIGPDVQVIAGSLVAFSVKGKDKFGAIAKREIKVGTGSFISLGKQDTSMVVSSETGKVDVIGRVTDDDGNSDEDTMAVVLVAPTKSNNDLASLIPSAGLLAPGFQPAAVFYSLVVGFKDSMIAITPTTADPKATLFVNDKLVTSGSITDSVAVSVGTTPKVFEIRVTAQDGKSNLYTIAVTRAPSNDASLAKLEPAGFTLKPAFAGATFDYADTVAFKISSATIKPTASHPFAKILVNDTVLLTGTVSNAINLDVGDNLIKVGVTAQDGKTKSTYTIKVVRKAKIILTRVVGTLTAQVDSLEAPLGTIINAKAPDSTGFHFTKWALIEGTGTWVDSTVNPAKLTVKAATVRARAAFAINVYTITTTISGVVGGVIDRPTISIEHGKDTILSIATTSYRILSLMEGDKALTPMDTTSKFGDKKYKLGPATKNRDLVVTFKKTYTVNVVASIGGTVTPQGTTEIDADGTFNLSMTATGKHFWVSAFTDNTADSLQFVLGDKMATSTYVIANIDTNHALNVTFALRNVRMTVIGSKVSACATGTLCFIACPIGQPCLPAPDSLTYVVEFGSSFNISTADSVGKSAFSKWQKDGVDFSIIRGVNTGILSGDATFRANYVCTCGKFCCLSIEPPILIPTGTLGSSANPAPSPTLPQSKATDPN